MADAQQDFDPAPHALAKLFGHVLQKGFQAGGLLGLAVVAPVVAFRHSRRGGQLIASQLAPQILAAVGTTAGITTAISGLMCAGKVWGQGMSQEGLQDRIYRLHYNASQNRTDHFARVGAVAGTALAAAQTGGGGNPRALLGGAALGAAGGVLAHLATAARDDSPNKMVHELKTPG